jgi:sugar lactone lactonase YvrE
MRPGPRRTRPARGCARLVSDRDDRVGVAVSEIEMLAYGYGLVEGPRVDADDNLFFSDVHDGGVYCRRPDGTLETVVPKRRGVGGIALHTDGGLVISGRNICHVRDGETRVVFAPDAPGLNDLFVDAAGRVICGTMRSDPFALDGGPRTPGECWLIDDDGNATELYGDVALTNGIGLSPDGRVLYHSDTTRGVWAHDYDDGAVSERRLLVHRDDLMPDGLAVDEAGTVWVADVSGSGAVRGFAPDGSEVGRVEVPARMVTSLCFGGSDRRDLYIVTGDNTADPARRGTIFTTRAAVPGCRVTAATV